MPSGGPERELPNSPIEDPANYDHDKFVSEITADVLGTLRKQRFFELLDD
jgi:hypothetical protein